jgi:hypothetical protein
MRRNQTFRTILFSLVFALASLSQLDQPPAAIASSSCDSSATSLNAAIAKGSSVKTIRSLASNFRSCMSRQADSANAVDSKTGEAFYLVFTDSNLYTKISKGKSFGITALQHYRFALDGGGGRVSGCNSYSSLSTAAKSKAALSLSSFANKARILCQSLVSSTPRGLVSVTGDIYPGSMVVGSISGDFPKATLTYVWRLQGVLIMESSSSSFIVPNSAVGKTLELQVEIKSVGLNSVTNSSAEYVVSPSPGGQDQKPGDSGLVLTPVPTMSGTAQVGSTLTAKTGAWDSGVTLTYQWLRNGVAISGATSLNYVLVAADEGKLIAIKVTGSKAGVPPVSQTSNTFSISQFCVIPVPTISGSPEVGSRLTAEAGSWDHSVSRQWLRNGVAIRGAGNPNYVVGELDAGTIISVAVTGQACGGMHTKVSGTVSIPKFRLTPVPTISGFAQVGSTLTAATGAWESGVVLTYQWLRNGTAISGAAGLNYLLSSADGGANISFQVTGARNGLSDTQVSASLLVASATKILTLTPVPTLTGKGCLGVSNTGRAVTAAVGTWDSGVSLAFTWLRNGNPINGATFQSYTLTDADSGAALSFSVTGHKVGFLSVTRVSQARICVPPASSITGLRTVGSVLTAEPGTWDSAVTLSYQWFKTDKWHGLPFEWSPIAGAVSSTYQLQGTDAGESVHVKVTGTSTEDPRYSIAITSQSREIYLQAMSATNPQVQINGLARVGNTLTVSKGVWVEGAWLEASWYVDGVWIKNGDDYLIRAGDFGKKISVKVTGTKAYYSGWTTSSPSVTVT